MNIIHCDVCSKRLKRGGVVMAIGYIDTHKGEGLESDLDDGVMNEHHLHIRCSTKVNLKKLLAKAKAKR